MSADIRSIRSIERTPGYLSVHSLNRYGLYPYRGGEPKLPAPSYSDWNEAMLKAAQSAADWLRSVIETQSEIDRLITRFSSLTLHPVDVRDGNATIAKLLNHLFNNYMKHKEELRPELWDRIELALRHPALMKLSFRMCRTEDKLIDYPVNRLQQDDQKLLEKETADELKRLLLGASGFLTELKQAIDYSKELQPTELLRDSWHTTKPYMPYMAYYSSMQAYFPMPMVGMLVNRMY